MSLEWKSTCQTSFCTVGGIFYFTFQVSKQLTHPPTQAALGCRQEKAVYLSSVSTSLTQQVFLFGFVFAF